MPEAGQRFVVVDSDHQPVAVIEVTSVVVVPLINVDLAHALDEGEGYTSVREWRDAHVAFWQSDAMRDALGNPNFRVVDSTRVILERFELVGRFA